MSTTVVQSARITDIVRQIRGAALPFLAANSEASEAREANKLAGQHLTSSREGIMVALADLSMKGQWSSGEVKAAAKAAADLSDNEKEKALCTFISQCKLAMDPKVRMHVESLTYVRDAAWTAEKLAYDTDHDSPTPLRKAFARGYHCLMTMFKQAEQGRVFTNVPELLAYAEECNPDLDMDKVKARLAAIAAELLKFYSDWQVGDIKLCVDTLAEIDEKMLRASRNTTVVKPVVDTRPLAPIPATVVARIEAAKTQEENDIDALMAAA